MEHRAKIFFILCFLVVFLIYSRTLFGGFVFDDRGIIDNRYILEDLSRPQKILLLPYFSQEAGIYRPVVLISYTFNFIFFSGAGWSFHLINLVFYGWTGVLIFLLVRKIFKNRFLAEAAGLLFLVLPIHTEVVSNIIGRAEIFALFFSLLTLLQALKEKPSVYKTTICFFLAIGSKETAIALVPVLLFLVCLKEKSVFSRRFFSQYGSPFLGVILGAALYFFLRFFSLGPRYFFGLETSMVENPLKFVSSGERMATAFKILFLYFKKIISGAGLCSDYSFKQIPVLTNFSNFETVAGIVVLLFFVLSIFVFFRRSSLFSFGSAIFLFPFLPVSNLLFPIGTIAGDRLMYFPSLGIILIMAGIFSYLAKRIEGDFFKKIIFAIFVVLILYFSGASYLRSLDWLSEKRLFISAVQCAPNSVLSRSNMGALYYLEGDLESAERELLESRRIFDGYPKGLNNLGLVYWKKGEKEKAREMFFQALLQPFPYYGAYENLALMALKEDNFDEAEMWLSQFFSGNPQVSRAYIETYQKSKK